MRNLAPVSILLEENLKNFLNQLKIGNKSRNTIAAYKSDIHGFLEFLEDKKIRKASRINDAHLSEYISGIKECGKSDATVNRLYMSLKSFARFLIKIKAIVEDFTQLFDRPKLKLKPPYVPKIEEIERMLDRIWPGEENGMRDRAMLELLYSSGLRASELCDLQLGDFTRGHVQINCGKGSKTRCVPVTENASMAIEYYILNWRGNEEGYLFITDQRKKVQRQSLSKLVGVYAKQAGLSNVTAHTLRHACATHLLEKGADIRMIQEVLGHSSITTTQRYTQLSKHKLQGMFNQFHPRKNHA